MIRFPLKRLDEARELNRGWPAGKTAPMAVEPFEPPLRAKTAPPCHICGLPAIEQKFCRKCRAIYRSG